MQLYFIRHAQSTNNALYDATSSSQGRSEDPPLTEAGLRQAELLGQFLSSVPRGEMRYGRDPQNINGFHITHLYCSLMLRSIQTATKISQAIGIPATAWIDLHEEGGIYRDDEETGEPVGLPGVARAWLVEHYPNLVLPQTLGEEGWWNRDFEYDADRLPRAQRFYRELLERHGGTEDRVAIVSHGGFYNLLVHTILERPLEHKTWFVMNNAAISRVDFGNSMAVVYMNRTDFLPPELIT
jgi:2,3-bisphosphoglycerate-dependent phosphoglycerate mutase